MPDGLVAEAVAAFVTLPASTSAWVTTYVAVARTVWPGASWPLTAPGQVPYEMAERPGRRSSTATPETVCVPVFVTSKR